VLALLLGTGTYLKLGLLDVNTIVFGVGLSTNTPSWDILASAREREVSNAGVFNEAVLLLFIW
jgi:hypothetical protein